MRPGVAREEGRLISLRGGAVQLMEDSLRWHHKFRSRRFRRVQEGSRTPSDNHHLFITVRKKACISTLFSSSLFLTRSHVERTGIQTVHHVRALPIRLALSRNRTRNPSGLALGGVGGMVVLLDHGRFRDIRDGERCSGDKGADESSLCDSGIVVFVIVGVVFKGTDERSCGHTGIVVLVVVVIGGVYGHDMGFGDFEVRFCWGRRNQGECLTVPFTRNEFGGRVDRAGRLRQCTLGNDVPLRVSWVSWVTLGGRCLRRFRRFGFFARTGLVGGFTFLVAFLLAFRAI